jgi:cytoskeletal protein CcmA (bactofilin family)
MRRSCILLVLVLFVATSGAQARHSTTSDSLDDHCDIPSDPRWTPQEKFVWKHICIGEPANFNERDSFYPDLDPTKQDDWNPTKPGDRWKKSRILRRDFLKMILLKDPYRRALKPSGVVIRGARFTEEIDFEGAEFDHPLELQNSRLEKGIKLRRVRSKFPIGFQGSYVVNADLYELQLDADLDMRSGTFSQVNLVGAHVGLLILDHSHVGEVSPDDSEVSGKLNLNRLHVDQSLHMRNAQFTDVELVSARVGGNLELTGSTVAGKLNMDGLQVDRSLFMRNAKFSDVRLVGGRVDGNLELIGSKVAGKLNMNALHVEQSLYMRNAQFTDVELVSARVGGNLELDDAHVTGKLKMSSLHVAQSLYMNNEAEFSEVILLSAHVGGDLELTGSTVTGKLNLNGLEVDNGLFLRHSHFKHDKAKLAELELVSTRVGSQFDMSGSEVEGRLDCHGMVVGSSGVYLDATFSNSSEYSIYCQNAQIKGDLHLEDGQFDKNVDLSRAEIGGTLHLSRADVGNILYLHAPTSRWGGATFILRDAKAGAITALPEADAATVPEDAWASKLDLDGFTYRSAGGTDNFGDWLGRSDRYAQPHEQLASVVQNRGMAHRRPQSGIQDANGNAARKRPARGVG